MRDNSINYPEVEYDPTLILVVDEPRQGQSPARRLIDKYVPTYDKTADQVTIGYEEAGKQITVTPPGLNIDVWSYCRRPYDTKVDFTSDGMKTLKEQETLRLAHRARMAGSSPMHDGG